MNSSHSEEFAHCQATHTAKKPQSDVNLHGIQESDQSNNSVTEKMRMESDAMEQAAPKSMLHDVQSTNSSNNTTDSLFQRMQRNMENPKCEENLPISHRQSANILNSNLFCGESTADTLDLNRRATTSQADVPSMATATKTDDNNDLHHNDINITACTETSQFGASEISFNEVDNWLEEFQRERKDSYHYTTSSHDGDSTRSDSETPMQKLCNEVLNESFDTRGRINLGPAFDDTNNTSEAVWTSQQQPLIYRPQPTTNYSPTLPSTMPLTNETRAKRPSSDISNSSASKTPAKKRNAKTQSSPPVIKSRSRKRMDNALNERWQSKMALRDAIAALEKAKTQLNKCRSRYDVAKSLVQSTAKEEWESLLMEDTPWNDMFHQLKKYKEETGDCNVKQNFGAEDNKISPELVKLSAWVGKNRKEGKARGRGCAVTLPKVSSTVKQGKSCDEILESENDDQFPPNCESDANKSSSIDTCNQSSMEERDDSSVFEDIDPESIQADPYKEIALDDIGFDWNPRNSRWNSMVSLQ